MIEAFVALFTRLVVAVEKIAANGGGGFVAEKAADPKPEKPKKEKAAEKPVETKAEEKPAPKKNPFADDDETPPAVVVTKEQVRKALTDYANATDNDEGLKLLAANTSNKASKIGEIKSEDYAALYAVVTKALAETKK